MTLKYCYTKQDVIKQIDIKANKDAIPLIEFFDTFIDMIEQDAPLSTDELRSLDSCNQETYKKKKNLKSIFWNLSEFNSEI